MALQLVGGSAGELLCIVRGSIAGGTDTTCPRDNECDEGRKRKLTISEPDAEGVYCHLKGKRLQPCFLNLSQDRSIFPEHKLIPFTDFQKYPPR